MATRENTRSSFIFETILLNQKPSKVLLKCIKISGWITFKENFSELEVFKLKNVLKLKITPFLIKSYFLLSDYQQVTILLIIYPVAIFSFWSQSLRTQTTLDNFLFSRKRNAQTKQDVKCIAQLNSGLNAISFSQYKVNKTVVFFININQKLKSSFYLLVKDNPIKQNQRPNWGTSFVFCHDTINKKNSLKKTQTNAKSSKTLNLVTRTKSKIVINCHHLYFKEKTKNYLLGQSPIYPINHPPIFLSLPNKYDLNSKINKGIELILLNQKGFSWYHRNTKKSFVVRPLLFITRFDLKKVCAFWKLPVYPDQTNEKLIYFRNRIRKQLLPLLRFFFNPQIDKLFLQFAEIANTEQLYLDRLASHLQDEFQIKKACTFELSLSVFNFIPIAIQRRLLKQFLGQYFTKQIKFFHIEILIDVLAKRKKSHFKLSEKFKYNTNLLIQENFKIEYKMYPCRVRQGNDPKVIFRESLSVLSMAEENLLDKLKVSTLTNKIESQFLQHFSFAKQGINIKAKVKHNFVNLDKKLKIRNIFSDKNKLETPQILFFTGIGTCFLTSRRFVLLSNFPIV